MKKTILILALVLLASLAAAVVMKQMFADSLSNLAQPSPAQTIAPSDRLYLLARQSVSTAIQVPDQATGQPTVLSRATDIAGPLPDENTQEIPDVS